ncbi:hypothetical protein B0J18DRAFT_416826 [Chaetomium sp. MPI-SDFR-AT-0129]|nr:hypothetical protein B0J18DRAFT_416826 [Chaetomium sp. MPI-SDFR-AT-0129]
MQPLCIQEMRWAMVIDVDCPHRSLEAYKNDEEYVSDNAQMTRKVQTLSRGLAEVTQREEEV